MDNFLIYFCIIIGVIVAVLITVAIVSAVRNHQYKKTTYEIQQALEIDGWLYLQEDAYVPLKSSKAVSNYDVIQYFKENRDTLHDIYNYLLEKQMYGNSVLDILDSGEFSNRPMYRKVENDLRESFLKDVFTYNILVRYISPAGRKTKYRRFHIKLDYLENLMADPSVLMTKSEYNKLLKTQNKEILDQKHHDYYEQVNNIIDYANENKNSLVIKGDQEELDKLIASLFDRTVNSIKKVKDIDSEEWSLLDGVISSISDSVKTVVDRNQRINEYYRSSDFERIKKTCDSLMESQRDFNNYINDKARSISKLFGTRIVRNETVVEDEFNYIRPYKKTITPFTAEVSAQVFASAENSPTEYIVKYFYPNKDLYPEQIQKLQLLIEELETLKDAKRIIENYKKDYQQYLSDVPSFIMENDEDGFYSHLGFADVSESALTVEYKFSYTSGGGMAQRSFSIPMTEETIIDLINILQNKLTMVAFTKEQRNLMTSKLRQHIKERDNYTCRICGNSTFSEPNLLLEIDHIIPVAKGGATIEENLQTLCWKCNRSKSSKLI